MRTRGDVPEVAFGLFLLLLSLAGLYGTKDLPASTASELSPAFTPSLLLWSMLAGGLAFIAKGSISRFEPLPHLAWRSGTAVLAALAAFALCFQWLGLVIAATLAAFVASMARPIRPRFALFLAAGVAAAVATWPALPLFSLSGNLKLWPW